MQLNPGDKIRILKKVFDKDYTLKPGQVLEIVWGKKKSMSHIRRCVDHNGRTRYVHMADAALGCFEKIYEAPVVVNVPAIGKPNENEQMLLKQIQELKDSQNILAEQHAREISMILKSKGTEMQRDDALADLNARLKTSMRNWVLGIQFNAQLTPMRKEIQNYLKELE